MNSIDKKQNKSSVKKDIKDIFYKGVINKNISLSIVNIGDNLKDTIEQVISKEIEGKCISEGYIKPNSTKIISYSSGLIDGANILFSVIFECLICYPTEGMIINCNIKNITKAGIKAQTNDEPSPVIIFLAKEHHKKIKSFTSLSVEDNIQIKVIGQRYELHDKFISIIGELVEKKKKKQFSKKRIVITN
tara:strand:- start:7648 stop:8217 length:570 start_codon:yes stop_codon:yes gene_type:complete